MDHQTTIDLLEKSDTESTVRQALTQADAGITQTIFEQIRQLAGSDPDRAKRLSRWWPQYLRLGENPAYAYRIKGVDRRFSGDWQGSAQAYRQAGQRANDPLESLTIQIGAIDALGRAGKVDQAVRLAKQLHKGLLERGAKEDAARVCVNTGNALNWHDRYSEAARWFKQGLSEFGNARTLERAATLLGLSTDELFAGSPAGCIEHASEAAAIFEELGLPHYARLSELNQAHSELFVGKADAGLARLLRLREEFVKESEEEARIEEFIGDAHLALNRWEEAADAYRTALDLPGMAGMKVNIANCYLGLGQAEMALNHSEQALEAFKRAAQGYRRFGNTVWAAIADVQRAALLRDQGKQSTSSKLAISVADILKKTKASYFEAIAQLLIAEASIGKEHDYALRRARSLIRRNGYAALYWRLNEIRARKSHGKKRRSAFRAMVADMLSHRAMVQSTTGSIAYFRDKERALDLYLQDLLESSSTLAHQEALDVIRKTRAVALLDEILSARRTTLSSKLQESLASLREEIAMSSSADVPGGPIRRLSIDAQMSHLQRRWVEWEHEMLPAVLRHSETSITESQVAYVQTGSDLYAVGAGHINKLEIDANTLRRQLSWMRYELLAPMVDPNADAGRVLALGKELAEKILEPYTTQHQMVVSPDRQLWQVPWQLLGDLTANPVDVVLATALWPTSANASQKKPENTALWYFPTPELPHIEREAMAFLERYPQSLVCRTIDEVRDCMASERVDLLHIAAHAQFHRSNPMFSAIALNRGKIVAAEITRARFRVNTVILSACDSGSMSLVNRLEPDGLTRSFLSCGASWVVSTQWPLHDVAAKLFVDAFYESLTQKGNVLRAARAGRERVRNEFDHPYYWAPFVTYGGYEA